MATKNTTLSIIEASEIIEVSPRMIRKVLRANIAKEAQPGRGIFGEDRSGGRFGGHRRRITFASRIIAFLDGGRWFVVCALPLLLMVIIRCSGGPSRSY